MKKQLTAFISCCICITVGISITSCSPGNVNAPSSNNTINYAYITNEQDNSYSQCTVAKNGSLSDCYKNFIANLKSPTDIKFHNDYAYIINSESNNYTKCQISIDGSLDDANCQTSSQLNGATRLLKIAFQGNNAYIINHNQNSYVQCSVDINGDLQGCAPHNNLPGTHVGLTSISFNNNKAYFTADIGKPIQCDYNNGNLINCQNIISSALGGINGISFNNNFAYLGIDIDSEYSVCTTTNDNLTCSLHKINPSIGTYFNGITFNNNIAYLIDYDNSYSSCNVGTNGMLVNCITENENTFNKSTSIAFHTAKIVPHPAPTDIKEYFYGVQGGANKKYTKCEISSNYELTSCSDYIINLTAPQGISFFENNAYIIDSGFAVASINPGYTICKVSPINGALEKCQRFEDEVERNDGYENPFFEAKQIAFHNKKAYMTLEDGTIESSGYSTCNIGKDKTLTDCVAHRNTLNLDRPYYISINNNYAYITDNPKRTPETPHSYVICKINSQNGLLENCNNHSIIEIERPTNITFNNNKAYIGDYNSNSSNNSYAICNINSLDGSLVNCTAQEQINGLDNHQAQTIINNGHSYTIYGLMKYSSCQINDTTGLYENCTLYDNIFDIYVDTMAFYKYQVSTN